MDSKRIIGKIKKELTMYKVEIDKLAVSYQKEIEEREKELGNADNKFTESYISECRRNWKPKINYAGLIDMARETHQKSVNTNIEQIEQWLNEYFRTPVEADFASTLVAIKSLGVTLSDREFAILQGTPNGYLGQRLLNELAVNRTKKEQRATLENGETKRVEETIKTPCNNVQLPDIEKTFGGLQNLKNTIEIALNGYAGPNNELADIIFPLSKSQETINENLKNAYGVEPPKPTRDVVTISKMASSKRCFDENHQSFIEFQEILDGIMATIPAPAKKKFLTEDDRRLIDTLIDSKYEHTAKSQAIAIAQTDERLKEILLLDKRYSSSICKALGMEEGSE